MKHFLLFIAISIFFSCSRESVAPEKVNYSIESAAEQNSQKSTSSSNIEYIGVFGHGTNRDLHGKIAISKINDGLYSASINLLKGSVYEFFARKLENNNQLFFKGENGSFTFNISDTENPIATDVYIVDDTPGYIEAVKKIQAVTQVILLGTYQETGNEANFYGNWDLIGTSSESFKIKRSPQLSVFEPTQAIISHGASGNPFEDFEFEPYDDPSTCYYPQGLPLFTGSFSQDGSEFYFNSLSAQAQTSIFAGHEANWQIYYEETYEPLYQNANCENATSGTWSWNGKTGEIYYEGAMF